MDVYSRSLKEPWGLPRASHGTRPLPVRAAYRSGLRNAVLFRTVAVVIFAPADPAALADGALRGIALPTDLTALPAGEFARSGSASLV